MNKADAHALYLVQLVSAALHHSECPAPPEAFSSEFLVELIRAHHLSTMLYPMLKDRTDVLNAEVAEVLRRECLRDQMRDASQEDALEELSEAFEKCNIPFMPMKGIIQKRYYEKPHHRMMGDLDILIGASDRAKVREVMESLGYDVQSYEVLYDDVYYRRPFLNVEIHVALGKDADFSDSYFAGIWERAEKKADESVSYEMSLTDYYLYFVHHAAKHCKGHGTGIRTLIDLWYLKRALLPVLDRSFLDEQLERFGSLKFEKELSDLCDVWFEGKDGDCFQNESMRRFLILDAGLYGNFSNTLYRQAIADGDLQKSHAKKRGVFFRRIFLPKENMKVQYPILERNGWLLVFCWIHRIFKTLFRPKKVQNEVRLYSKVSRGMDLQTEMRVRFGFAPENGTED